MSMREKRKNNAEDDRDRHLDLEGEIRSTHVSEIKIARVQRVVS